MTDVTQFIEALDGLIDTQQDYYRCMEAVQIIHDGKLPAWRREEADADFVATVVPGEMQRQRDRNAEIKALIDGGLTTRQVASRFGISAPQVSRIARGLSGR